MTSKCKPQLGKHRFDKNNTKGRGEAKVSSLVKSLKQSQIQITKVNSFAMKPNCFKNYL